MGNGMAPISKSNCRDELWMLTIVCCNGRDWHAFGSDPTGRRVNLPGEGWTDAKQRSIVGNSSGLVSGSS